MSKNGLFLISIGLIIFLLSSNAVTGQYDLLSIVTAVTFIIFGTVFILKKMLSCKIKLATLK
ncbi:DUF3188 domain-containing protein [Vagococcus jeotgali]|uniref:DUF3188 domain-containing protein n=1 Tax=Vagococcus jeotgali TaxID=3109030 RepID=UPI002DD9B886|nr:DUF3188 domain-containing protein [Vagococcus sp. B2T-5]